MTPGQTVFGKPDTRPRVALCTTTINVPVALRAFRALDPDVRFFVAGDLKTPAEAKQFCDALPNTRYISPDEQKRWACSELIGWNCVQRRNIAFLEALEWGADILVSWDDDNLFVSPDYFERFVTVLTTPYRGISVSGFAKWFDVGRLLDPVAPHRGFPIGKSPLWRADAIAEARVGVAAGICLGDPDVSAVDRISRAPEVHRASELLRSGIVVQHNTWTVFNSQNTAFVRELAPAMFMLPGVGRHDDIYASLICQTLMQNLNYHVHFGQPFCWQSRNEHNLLKDLHLELMGMEHIEESADYLMLRSNTEQSSLNRLRACYDGFRSCGFMPEQAGVAGLAWCDDIEKVMR